MRQRQIIVGIVGIICYILAFIFYFLYEAKKTPSLAPLGIAFFLAGFYLTLSLVKTPKEMKTIVPLMCVALFVFWFFLTTGYDKYLLDSRFGKALTQLTIIITTSFLNLIGISSSYDKILISFPSYSKVSSITVDARCSGVHSLIIFVFFYAIMLIDVGRGVSKKRLLSYFIIGTVGLYFVNVFRVILVSLIGIYFGFEPMWAFHTYAGLLFFLGFMGIFWYWALSSLLLHKQGLPARTQSKKE